MKVVRKNMFHLKKKSDFHEDESKLVSGFNIEYSYLLEFIKS